jgi:YHS domain-containing protein
MSLGLVKDIMGERYAQTVMLDLEYDPQPPVTGGNENNTDKAIVEYVRAMYDGAIEPILNPNKRSMIKIDNQADPICGMSLSAGFTDTLSYKGKVYGFCSKHCKEGFKRNSPSIKF